METLITNVNGATNKLEEATTKQKSAFDNLEKASNTQHIAITEADNASKMVHEYWTILKTCEEAVKRMADE